MPDSDDEFPDVEFFDDPPERKPRDGDDDSPSPPSGSGETSVTGEDADEPFSLGAEPEQEEAPAARGSRRGRSRGGRRRRGKAGTGSEGGGRPPGGRGRRRGGSSAGGPGWLQKPIARLALGAAFVGILVLVLVLVVRECQRNQLVDSYKTYMNEVAELVDESAEQGKQLRLTLTNASGDNPPQLRTKVTGIRDEAQTVVDRARGLGPPGGLNAAQQSLVTTFEYRVTGLESLAENLPTIIESRDNEFAATALANSMQRFLASDVIYDDSFVGPAKRALADDDISDVKPPEDKPFLPNAGFASANGAKALLPGLRRQSAAQGGDDDQTGNLRGTSLVKTEALPSETRLTPDSATSVQASEELKWRITIENGGDFVENGIIVRAKFSYPDSPGEAETQETSIETIAPGDQIAVEIPGPSAPEFGEQGTLDIEVVPVPNESRVDNNRATYPVTITI